MLYTTLSVSMLNTNAILENALWNDSKSSQPIRLNGQQQGE